MKTLTKTATVDNDYQAMVEEGRLICFGLCPGRGDLGAAVVCRADLRPDRGSLGMIGAVVFWFAEDAVKP